MVPPAMVTTTTTAKRDAQERGRARFGRRTAGRPRSRGRVLLVPCAVSKPRHRDDSHGTPAIFRLSTRSSTARKPTCARRFVAWWRRASGVPPLQNKQTSGAPPLRTNKHRDPPLGTQTNSDRKRSPAPSEPLTERTTPERRRGQSGAHKTESRRGPSGPPLRTKTDSRRGVRHDLSSDRHDGE